MPANQIVGLLPGELFVHRNVANVVVHTDLNCLSVLQYAIDVLRIEHVIVCGHYGCGGVRAAYSGASLGLADNWLRHVQDVRDQHDPLIREVEGDEGRIDRLCELNVVEQVATSVRPRSRRTPGVGSSRWRCTDGFTMFVMACSATCTARPAVWTMCPWHTRVRCSMRRPANAAPEHAPRLRLDKGGASLRIFAFPPDDSD